MKTNAFLSMIRQAALMTACVSVVGFSANLTTFASESDSENYIVISVGTDFTDGDKAAFQQGQQTKSGGVGGIEDLYLYKILNDDTDMILRGHALAGSNDYLFDLTLNKIDVGYLKLGYKQYSVWFDGSGGYYPPTDYSLSLYDESLRMDRGNFWFEAGYTPEVGLNFVFRYDLFTRDGKKDSTSWGDTNFNRYIIPSFYQIDERRHQLTAVLSEEKVDQKWEVGLRYDKGDYDNSRNIRRRPGDAGRDRYLTHTEGRDYDLFQVRGLYVNKLNEMLMLTTAVAQTRIDSTTTASRIYGADYYADFRLTSLNMQNYDHGYYDLNGASDMIQTVGTINALYRPNENWSIVPSFRVEKISWDNSALFQETAVQGGQTSVVEMASSSDKGWYDISESIDARYRGIKNVVINFKAEWVQADGDLTEKETEEPGTAQAHVGIDRDTDFDRKAQKYSVTANIYPRAGTTIALQYYIRNRENEYNSPRDSTDATGRDRYPAYVAKQDFETSDFNARVSWRINPMIRTVTRYDYQTTTITTQEIGLAMAESMNVKRHVLAETLSINPLKRWYLQAMVNYVWDELTTPAVEVTGSALNRVMNSNANFMNLSVNSGYALNDGSDLIVDYSLYRSFDDFTDNSAYSVAYGSQLRTQQIGLAWRKLVNERTTLTMRYTFAKSSDSVFGGLNDYESHIIQTKLQYRF